MIIHCESAGWCKTHLSWKLLQVEDEPQEPKIGREAEELGVQAAEVGVQAAEIGVQAAEIGGLRAWGGVPQLESWELY